MRKLTLCFALFLIGCHPSQRADQGVQITTPVTIVGLPAGCSATASGNVITVTGCPTAPPPAVTITASCTAPTVVVGKTVQCTAQVGNTSNTTVNWSSSATSVATVDSTGLVTGVAAGSVNIIATSLADNTKSTVIAMQCTGTPTTVTQDAAKPIPLSSGPVLIQTTGDPPIAGVGNQKVTFQNVTQWYDYNITVPVAGMYAVTARLGTDASVTGGTLIVHFEKPAGARITTPMSVTGANVWSNVASNQFVAFDQGATTVRLVVDSLPTATQNPGFIHWFQLVPSTTAVQHTVTLNWTPGTSTDPSITTASSFNVYRSQTSGSYSAQSVAAQAPPFIDASVQSGITYYYRVTGVNPTATTPESTPSNEVKIVIPTTRSKQQATVKWGKR